MIRNRVLLVLIAALVVVAGACSKSPDAQGVASLSGSDGEAAAASSSSDEVTEEQILDWVECMRDEGLDIPDPTVDSDGNLVLGGGPRPGRTDGADAPAAAPIDREAFQAATEKCGEPPRAGGGFSEDDRQELQDSALAFAQCLRDEGLDVADPDFSAIGPGGPPPSADDDGGAGADGPQRGGLFGGLDMDDPEVQAAMTACRSTLGDAFPGGGRGPNGAGSAAGGN